MKKHRRHVFLAVALLFIAGGLVWHNGLARTPQYQPPLEDLRLFSDVYARIKTDYVEEVEDKKLIEGAIRGMLQSLDPYSVFMTRREYDDLKVGTTGKFGGLGIEVGMEDGLVKVISPIEDTPAAKAGLVSGDLIVQIDDDPVKGMTLSDAVDKMRGLVGTKVKLIVLRGDEAPFDVEITRAVIKVKSVKTTLLEDEFGYVRITKFQVKTAQLLKEKLEELKKEAEEDREGTLQGLILDLRSNPGGVLAAAVDVSDVFLGPQQLVVYTQGRTEDSVAKYLTKAADVAGDLPMVVLLNRGSASASEIVAGALQDHKRAKIIGTQSFGKGSVQTVHPLDKRRALKLTTAKYYTPLGRSIHDVGITPDLVLDTPPPAADKTTATDVVASETGEAKPGDEAEPSGHDAAPPPRDLKTMVEKDFQVQRAIKELRDLAKIAKKT